MRILFALCSILFLMNSSMADDSHWIPFSHKNELGEEYSISLIKEEGLFSKKYISWAKVSRKVDDFSCDRAPTEINISDSLNLIYHKQYCAAAAARARSIPVEEIYKITIECDKKSINWISENSVNASGSIVKPIFQVGTYPGSFGYALMEHYCNK